MIQLERFKSAIRKRRSIRTYKKDPLNAGDMEKVKAFVNELKDRKGPFDNGFTTLDIIEQPSEKNERIGTYGFIKNAPAFIVGSCPNTKENLIDYGYLFEILVLELTEIGIGSVWLGGTFKRTQFDTLKTNQEDFIPAITPIGYKNEKNSLREFAIRQAAKADNRKDFGTLFMTYPSLEALKRKDEPKIAKVLDMVRRGPSASNKQPWRIIYYKNTLHVYLQKDPKYNARINYDIQYLDIGIALSHLEIGLKTHDFSYKTLKDPLHIDKPNFEYIISYKIKRHKR